jgi:hypothetical protein
MDFVLDYEQPRCETCRWWMNDGSPTGECMRYPPLAGGQLRPSPNGYGLDWVSGLYPETGPRHFCGEHQAAPTK